MNPPGRFLKQDPKTKLWNDVGEKKSLDKTRQALREGAPDLMKEIDGVDTNSAEYKFENQDALGPLRAARQNNPLTNSLMGNISLGSFGLSSLDHQSGAELAHSTAPLSGVPAQIQTSNTGLIQDGTNALLVAATQMQQLQQQQQQQQQLQLLQQQASSMTPAQLQLLQNHLQMNQQQQQQNNGGFNNMAGGNNMLLGNNGGYDAALAAAQASSNMGSEQVAALLNAFHNHASNNSATDMLQQQLTQQLLTQNLLNQMNSSNSTIQAGNPSNNINQNVQHGFHFQQNAAQHEDSTVPANVMSNPMGTSRARAQQIGLKNSFTQQRRPNRHLTNYEQALMGNSLMSVESINMDQLRMSGVSLGEFTGNEMGNLFEPDRDLGKAKDKTDDVSEVSDAMSDDAMDEDEKEPSK